jgi:hypothetical protein
MTTAKPSTPSDSSATPHMAALHEHIERLRAAHGRIHTAIDAHVADAAAAHRERQQGPPEDTE